MKKKMIVWICVALVGLSGCAPMSRKKKAGLGLLFIAQGLDGLTTLDYLRVGGTEANLFLDDRPSRDQVWLFKGLVTLTLYGLGEIFEDDWEFFYGIGIISGAGAAAYNNHLYEKWK